MPTILRRDGLRFVIYPNDHRPAHVHVVGPRTEAVYVLNCPKGPPTLRESFGFKTIELNEIVVVLGDELGVLCGAWERIHDH